MPSKPVSPIPQSPRLLDQLRELLRYKNYSLRTEKAYLHRVRFFVRWHGRNGQVRHPLVAAGSTHIPLATLLAEAP